MSIHEKTSRKPSKDSTPKTLTLHIGTHKTGTSAIQLMLKRCRTDVAAQGVNVINIQAHKLKKALRSTTGSRADAVSLTRTLVRNAVLRSRAKSLSHYHNTHFLLSWEGLCGTPISGYKEAEQTANILSLALGEDYTAKVVVFLRRQDLFAESMYAQYIRQGMSFSFTDFLNTLPDRAFDWERLISSYADAFGEKNILAIPYEKEMLRSNDHILDLFCNAIGISLQQIDLTRMQSISSTPNQSWTKEGIALARLCADSLATDPKRALRHLLDQSKIIGAKGASFMTYEERNAFLASYEDSNSAVLKRFANCDRSTLFANQSDYLEQEEEGQEKEEQLRLLAALIAQLAENQQPKKLISRLLRRNG